MQKLSQLLLAVSISIISASIIASASTIVQVRVQEERISQITMAHDREIKAIARDIAEIKENINYLIRKNHK